MDGLKDDELNRLYERTLKLEEQNKVLVEAVKSVASEHVKIEDIYNWEFQDAVEVIVTDTKKAREALAAVKEIEGEKK